MKRILRVVCITAVGILLLTVIAYLVYRPLRSLVPELVGMTKISDNVYVDDVSKASDAIELANDSIKELAKDVIVIERPPRMLFCYREKTFRSFGFRESAARSIGGIAVVLSPRAIYGYFLKHELIHYWQSRNLGFLCERYYPQWIIEGMAYSMSNDPRHPLNEPWETYRRQFETWYKDIDENHLKEELRKYFKMKWR
jgi:hypothetical protein